MPGLLSGMLHGLRLENVVCENMKTNMSTNPYTIHKHAPASLPLGIVLGGWDLVILPDFTENMGFLPCIAAFRYVELDFLKVDAVNVFGLVEARRSRTRSEEPSWGIGSAVTSAVSKASRETREKSDQRMVDYDR